MSLTLFNRAGHRKYLTADERAAFIQAAVCAGGDAGLFCLTIALTGARISEVLQISIDRIDEGAGVIVMETLKRRKRGIFRAVPVPDSLIHGLKALALSHTEAITGNTARIWTWSRTTAWKRVKDIMSDAGICDPLATPRALRHGFAVNAVQNKIALSVIKKWLGHAKIETTAIYADPVGPEERELAKLMWGEAAEMSLDQA